MEATTTTIAVHAPDAKTQGVGARLDAIAAGSGKAGPGKVELGQSLNAEHEVGRPVAQPAVHHRQALQPSDAPRRCDLIGLVRDGKNGLQQGAKGVGVGVV